VVAVLAATITVAAAECSAVVATEVAAVAAECSAAVVTEVAVAAEAVSVAAVVVTVAAVTIEDEISLAIQPMKIRNFSINFQYIKSLL